MICIYFLLFGAFSCGSGVYCCSSEAWNMSSCNHPSPYVSKCVRDSETLLRSYLSFLLFLHSLLLRPHVSLSFLSCPPPFYSCLLFLSPHSALFLPFYVLPASSSLYQPPRPRPSAVWSPCAATNMGRAAVPAWPASWSKWPDSARRAQTAATHPAAATGGEEEDRMNRSLWILMNPQHVTVLKIWAAVLIGLALNVAQTLL